MKANELTSCALRTPVWHPARAKAARTVRISPSKLATTTSVSKFLSSHRETALCSSLTETHPLHPSYWQQTLHHGKLQDALAGSMLGSSGPRLASRRPWWYLQVDRSSSGRARPTHIGGLVVWVNHHKNRPIISPRLCWLYALRRMSAPRVPSIHRFGATHELWPPVRSQYPLPSSLRSPLPPHSSHLATKRLSAAL